MDRNENLETTVRSADYVDQKELENMEYLNCLCSMVTSDAKCTREIKSRNAVAKAATTILLKCPDGDTAVRPSRLHSSATPLGNFKCRIS